MIFTLYENVPIFRPFGASKIYAQKIPYFVRESFTTICAEIQNGGFLWILKL